MGGGASIEIKHTHASFMHVTDSHFQELLSSQAAREALFIDIAKFPVDGKTDRRLTISLSKLAAYFTNNANSLYPGFRVNVDTLNAAFKYTVQKFRERQSVKKNKSLSTKQKAKIISDPQLTKPMVHSFLPTLLLFMRVWDVFDAADKLVVEDQRVFKGEFMRIKDKLNHVQGVVIFGETSDEDWEKEFNALDKNNDRFISFEEMCSYALDHIKKPFDYNPSDEDALLEGDDEDDADDNDDGEDGLALMEIIGRNALKLSTPSQDEKAGQGTGLQPEAAGISPEGATQEAIAIAPVEGEIAASTDVAGAAEEPEPVGQLVSKEEAAAVGAAEGEPVPEDTMPPASAIMFV